MPKTLTEVVAEAHRRLSVLSVDEDPSTDQVTYGSAAAASLLEELNSPPHSMAFTWTVETVPDAVYRPFAWAVAADLATHYLVPAESREKAIFRVRQYASPDDRDDFRDIDDDGVVTESEIITGKMAEFY